MFVIGLFLHVFAQPVLKRARVYYETRDYTTLNRPWYAWVYDRLYLNMF